MTLRGIKGRMARDCTIGNPRNCMAFQRKSSLNRLTADSAWCYTFATLFRGQWSLRRCPYPNMAQDNDVL